MSKKSYQKYTGTGNNFLMVDNLDDKIKDYFKVTKKLISEKDNKDFDGVIFIEESSMADFKMNYFNKDGSGNTLCGNGLRATIRYLLDNKLFSNKEIKLEAVSKVFDCIVKKDDSISVKFPPPEKIKIKFKLKIKFVDSWQLLTVSYVNVGSPHVIVFIDDIEQPRTKKIDDIKIIEWGREIRMHHDLLPEGANVNFVEIVSRRGTLKIRSYERGVEGETLSCGTGALAAGIAAYALRGVKKPVTLQTRAGENLIVNFDVDDFKITDLFLTGTARRL
jgi:diaminopimelate epimerase